MATRASVKEESVPRATRKRRRDGTAAAMGSVQKEHILSCQSYQRLSNEQKCVVDTAKAPDATLKKPFVVRVTAGAGTGKTTTLECLRGGCLM